MSGDPLSRVSRAAAAASRASARAADLRRARDDLVRAAHREGAGVREIARAAGMDPTQVSRVLRRTES
jgi:DNA-binding MarR family transcriptional regulator